MMDQRKTNFQMGQDYMNQSDSFAKFNTLEMQSPAKDDSRASLLDTSNRFARPGTAGIQGNASIRSQTPTLQGNRRSYFKNKLEGEQTRIVLGNESRDSARLLGRGATDYRTNYQWTVPKFAV